jgi:hypothetical protein
MSLGDRLGGTGVRQKRLASERQQAQKDLVEQARALPGVADVVDLYARLSPYTVLGVYLQPGQVRNATGGNG